MLEADIKSADAPTLVLLDEHRERDLGHAGYGPRCGEQLAGPPARPHSRWRRLRHVRQRALEDRLLYHGDHYPRLLSIKQRYDPGFVLWSQPGVGSGAYKLDEQSRLCAA
ncbi:hypothetical protein BDV95DRAFT_250756 [Massariosphaeria phaeospora]|uniref:Berberine/berberine-like domain-containing protein n=1 Tax=Massariosphaeria phaeospora TaxID=100035 RepID=A0A7C8I2Z7_9PLEO|nr:hypothetical protein BDV95DRAFT_250756 [Massariosphaeria phaeospora]